VRGVDFELGDDQEALRDAAASLLDDHASPSRVRAVVDAGGGQDDRLWSALVAQGWPAVLVPEAQGGLGLGWVEVAVLLEQVGAHVAPAPIAQQILAIDALAASDSDVVATLDALTSGSSLGVVAFREVFADPVDGGGVEGWQLSGRLEPVVYGPSADWLVVRSADGLFLVDLAVVSPPVEPQPAMDRTRAVGWIELDGVPARRIGDADAVERFVDAGAVAYSAELLGVASSALTLAVEYAKEREQFGRPIGSFQAVKHRCADMLVDVEGMRSVVYHAAWCLAADHPDRSVAASTAKTWCSDAGRRVTASCLQVHGGIGFTWESDVHLLLKRAQLDEVSFGDAVYHRTRLAQLLRRRVEAGDSVV
jgi:alkylation response protein AidB-like acyl-CoA dehydrogenase